MSTSSPLMNAQSVERLMAPVCLVVSPSPFLLDERVFMSLGILRIAAVLEQAGIDVEVLDLSGVENYQEAVRDHAAVTDAKVFGITATSPQMPAATNIQRTIRDVRPDLRIILGGPHVTLVNTAAKRELAQGAPGRASKTLERLLDQFDVLVAGDGENAVFLALDDGAPSLIDADDPKSELFLTNSSLTELPFPARHFVDVDSYRYTIDDVRALSLIAQLGCPFSCGFCGGRESPSLRRIRMRTTESIVKEIVHIHETYDINGFMLYDDELNVNPQMVQLMNEIERAQKDLGTEFRLRGFIKAELFTDQQAEAMYGAGFRWILTGFESGSPRILENINKKATREDNTRCVEIARRHGLKVKALMSVGHPGETEETIKDTHNWLCEVRPDDFDVTIITTYPGTPYYDHAVPHSTAPDTWTYTYAKTGDRLHSYDVNFSETADYYKGDPDGGYKAFVYTDELSSEDLVRLRDFVERDVRERLNIPFNPGAPALRYEHSMGQSGEMLPSNLLRSTRQKSHS
jgi:anaerobic magnesium-protoporphyrin IX monomethyl ester cyclase